MSEMVLESVPHGIREHDHMNENFDSPVRDSLNDWTDSVIPVHSVFGITAAGLASDTEFHSLSFRSSTPESPESLTVSEASDFSHVRELEKEMRRNLHCSDDFASDFSESCSDNFERVNGSYDNGQASPISYSCTSRRLERIESLESIYSSVRSGGSDGEDEETNTKYEKSAGDEKVMEWAKEHNNEPLQIVCGYHSLCLPARGSEIIFHPVEHLQPIRYCRPAISSLGLGGTYTSVELSYPSEFDEVSARLAAAEEALALSIWTTATVCRALSLESILTLFAGVLLEKQVVVMCPNLGVLSATVLSLVPMIRPFEWQSLLLPVLPKKILDFLDAPVPFIVGIQNKPAGLKIKTANLIRVNIQKDQAEAAEQFLSTLRCYLETLCSNLRSHTITSVQSNNDRVSLLLKDSFVDSFSTRDRPFIKLLVDTQLFSVLSDSRLSTYEHEHL